MPVAKILIIRFSSIGDIVLTTPVVRCLKEQFEGGVELHFLTKKAFRQVLDGNPYIDKVHTIERRVSEVLPDLKAERFDYIIDLHRNLRSGQVKRGLPGLSMTFDKLNKEKWLRVNLKVDRLPDVHIVERYFGAVSAFDIRDDGKGLDYFIPDDQQVDLADLPETHQSGYTAMVIGGTYTTKVYPPDKVISLCRELNEPVVLVGGPGDAERGKQIADAVGALAFNAAGNYSLHQSASLVQQAKAVVTNDTGLMHIAAAFGKKIVSTWGNTIPEFGMYPFLPKEDQLIAEVKGLSCRPCSKLGHAKCPKKHFRCMLDIDEKEIVEFLADQS